MKQENKMGILLISDGWSGAEKVVYEICLRLSKSQNIVLILNEEIIKYFEEIKNIEIINLGKLFSLGLLRFFKIPLIRRKIKMTLNEHLSLINMNLEYSFLMSYLNLPSNIKIIPTLHGTELNNFIKNKKTLSLLINHIILSYSLKIASKIISVSKHQIQNLTKKYKKKTIVIPNGVDTNTFKPLKNIKQKQKVVLFAGRFIELKGIREILSVARQLPKYEFWFAGQGPLSELINLPNTKNLGFKTTEELVKLYNQATICIFPSYRESFGLVGLEAMSCGKAVIATSLGFSEYIENKKDGIIIPAKDEKALKNALVDLMENSKKRKLIEKNARQKALQYDWDKVVKQYLKVFEEVVKENKPKKFIE